MRCFDICLAALDDCEPGSSSYALLLNHCLYVGMVGGIDGDKADLVADLARQLMVYCRSGGDAWSYRFDDTIRYYYYARAARAVAQLREQGAASRDAASSARKDMSEARQWFARIPSDPGGDVIAHRGLLRELEAELERLEVRDRARDRLPA